MSLITIAPLDTLFTRNNLTITNNISDKFKNGSYTISSSSYSNDKNLAYNAFNAKTTTFWESGISTNSNSVPIYRQDPYINSSPASYVGGGVPSTTFTTKVGNNAVPGEWIQIEIPYKVFIDSYSILPRQDKPDQFPRKFYLVGSNDGNKWEMIDQQVNPQPSLDKTVPTKFSLTTIYSYTRFRFIISEMTKGTSASICQLNLFGYLNLISNNVYLNNGFVYSSAGTVFYNSSTGGNIYSEGGTINSSSINNLYTEKGTINATGAESTINSENGSITANGGKITNNGGPVTSTDGTITNNGGPVTSTGGTITTAGGTLTSTGGTFNNNVGSINSTGGTITNTGGTINNNSAAITNNGGAITNNRGIITNNGGAITNNGGTIITQATSINKGWSKVKSGFTTMNENKSSEYNISGSIKAFSMMDTPYTSFSVTEHFTSNVFVPTSVLKMTYGNTQTPEYIDAIREYQLNPLNNLIKQNSDVTGNINLAHDELTYKTNYFMKKRDKLLDDKAGDYSGNSPLFKDKKPTLADGLQDDINTMIVKENNLYILGTITLATLLIGVIVITRG